jgi:hypothetical protein
MSERFDAATGSDRPGGIWRFVMHALDGRDSRNGSVVLGVDEQNLDGLEARLAAMG